MIFYVSNSVSCAVKSLIMDDDNFTVVDQYPKPGERVEIDSTVTVYYDRVASLDNGE